MPDGSLEIGMPAEAIDLALRHSGRDDVVYGLESAYRRRRVDPKHLRPFRKGRYEGQTLRPKRRATETRTDSSSIRNPHDAMGRALSQSPE